MRTPQFVLLSVLLSLIGTTAVAAPAVKVVRNQTYIERDSGPLGMDLYLPHGDGPFPGVLVVHGGAWTMGTRSQLAALAMSLAEHGFAAAAISYRLAPKDQFPAQLYDCQAAVRWLRKHADDFKIDATHIGGFGYSAGGQLVALLGTLGDDEVREAGVPADAPSARLQVVVAGGAPCDFRVLAEDSQRLAYWLGGTRADKPDAYRVASPAAFISGDDPPMFFFHGAEDALVPIGSPRHMVEKLTSAGVKAEMHEIPKAGHIEALFDRETLQLALAFADKQLKTAPGESRPSSSAKGSASDGQ